MYGCGKLSRLVPRGGKRTHVCVCVEKYSRLPSRGGRGPMCVCETVEHNPHPPTRLIGRTGGLQGWDVVSGVVGWKSVRSGCGGVAQSEKGREGRKVRLPSCTPFVYITKRAVSRL